MFISLFPDFYAHAAKMSSPWEPRALLKGFDFIFTLSTEKLKQQRALWTDCVFVL